MFRPFMSEKKRKSRYSYPIIIAAPHSVTEIKDKELRKRMLLTDKQIWKCSDPFTGELVDFTCARFLHKAPNHRLICDQNRAPTTRKAFSTTDFYGNKVFRKGKSFGIVEKYDLLEQYWHPYHDYILESIYELDKEGAEVILFVDYHNTANDHPINKKRDYMPSFVLSNLGTRMMGKKNKTHPRISIPSTYLRYLKKEITTRLPMTVELNVIYKGGFNMQWIADINKRKDINAKVYGIQLEYNLQFVKNPLSGRVDRKAMAIMQKALNEAIRVTYERIVLEERRKKRGRK
jgi:N-formylglutamate amidohydrolase